MNAASEFQAVNSLLVMIGEPVIPEPDSGSDREKLLFLIETYTRRLKEKIPLYETLPDDSLIPDVILVGLRQKLRDL